MDWRTSLKLTFAFLWDEETEVIKKNITMCLNFIKSVITCDFHWRSALAFLDYIMMCSVVMTGFVIISPGKSSPLKKILQFLAQNLFVKQAGKNCSKIDVTKCLCKCKVISSSRTQVT